MNIPQNRNQNNLEPKITALAITLNEEDNVKRYIQSLSFADEIIFIDSNSTDATVAIAKELGVKVIQRNFDDFSKNLFYHPLKSTHGPDYRYRNNFFC